MTSDDLITFAYAGGVLVALLAMVFCLYEIAQALAVLAGL